MDHTKKLNLFDSSTIIMGSMIGSGIFIVSADISRQVQSSGLMLLTWVLTAVMTMLAALSYGELAAMYPRAGGQYVYLKEAYGKLTAFTYGWSLFAVIQTGTIAAVAVAFARFIGVFVPQISDHNLLIQLGFLTVSTQQCVAVSCIVLLSLLSLRGVKDSAIMQNLFTVAKIVALLAVIIAGWYFSSKGQGSWKNLDPVWPESFDWTALTVFGAAMTGALFSADAWNNITFTAGEIKNPGKNLPLSLIIGTGVVLTIYFLINLIYVYMMPLAVIQSVPEDRVGTALMKTMMGDSGQFIMAAIIVISTFGCLNGLIFTAPRAYYAMAKDGLFLKRAKNLNKHGIPAFAVVIQMIWSSLLCLSGKYGELLDYLMFVVMLFYILTVGALFILRKKAPDLARPYKAIGYPVLPALYMILAAFICCVMLYVKTKFAVYGLIIIAIGVVIYAFRDKQADELRP
jgi:APA family basic amino acid/polyamine antiporter